jgi:DNA-binding IclR family transcriptional regulator
VTYKNGASAIAVVVQRENKPTPLGVVSISGPSVRLTKQRLEELIPTLKDTANKLALASVGSHYFNQSH